MHKVIQNILIGLGKQFKKGMCGKEIAFLIRNLSKF